MKGIHFIVIAGSVSTCLSSNNVVLHGWDYGDLSLSLFDSFLSLLPNGFLTTWVYFWSTSRLTLAFFLGSAGPGTVHVGRGEAGSGGTKGVGSPGVDAAEEGCHGDQQDSQRAAGEGASVSQQPPFLPSLAPWTSFRPVPKAAEYGKVWSTGSV